MRILKFGGTSVGSSERIAALIDIVTPRAAAGPCAVVVSALGDVTDRLIATTAAAADQSGDFRADLAELEERHRAVLDRLPQTLDRLIGSCFADLEDLLHGVWLLREISPRTRDRILSYGEVLSSNIVAAALAASGVDAVAVDARTLIVTDDGYGNARVDADLTAAKIRDRLVDLGALPVVSGFIAASAAGQTTTLGRGGSDYTAAILGAALEAEAIEIWTDVAGVMSADPRRVGGAFPLAEISYDELMEMSHFGARVIYPPTVHPAREAGIPLFIKSSLEPDAPGTRVVAELETAPGSVRGISSISQIALLRLEGDGMVGVAGVAARLFAALGRRRISVILISQASSEHSICFAIDPHEVDGAVATVHAEFDLERQLGVVDDLVVESGLSVLAVVGEGMQETPGIAGRVFSVLGDSGVNIHAIAQGSSELNISFVIAAKDEGLALRTIHDAFFAEPAVGVVVAGVGGVGGAFLDLLGLEAAELPTRSGVRLRLRGILRSTRMVIGDDLDPKLWREALEERGVEIDPALVDSLLDERVILVDCTASDDMVSRYDRTLAAGGMVVAANKKPFVGPDQARLSATGRVHHETTVGAALPVLGTIRQLVESGDVIERIEGVLSGTMVQILGRLHAGQPFSAAVAAAHADGVTEPDPREDLGGEDVARKLVILGRLAGFGTELADVAVESTLPGAGWLDIELDQFWGRLPELDPRYAEEARRAEAKGQQLVHIASCRSSGGSVAVVALDKDHPAAGLQMRDNVILVYTRRYGESPLVVRGAGAGREITAGGVLADLVLATRKVAARFHRS